MCKNDKKAGFTLVELSIVIVIIGFLIAGVTAGSNLIKQAELRSVISDLQGFTVSNNNFLSRFNAIPGDFNQAAAFLSSTDGNGNGIVEPSQGTTPIVYETKLAWVHLDLAGMLNSGVEGYVADDTLDIGSNAPPSKIANAGYYIDGVNTLFSTSTNAVFLGRDAGTLLNNAALSAEDTFSIDRKADDARVNGTNFEGASTGTIRAADAANVPAVADCVDATTGDLYNISAGTVACYLGQSLN